MADYLLGIDAGGTKTDFVLTDCNMQILKSITLGSANPLDCGIEQAQTVLQKGIAFCCDGLQYNCISCFAGIAGGISGNNKKIFHSFLSQFGFGSFDNGSDIDSCISMTIGNNDGVVVIMGTGIVAFCRTNNTLHRIGGWGYLIDKGGSGFNIGSDALSCALGCYDGRGGSELIKSLIEKQLNKTIPASIPEIYVGGKAMVASFVPTVFEAYRQNDAFANEILNRNITEVAALIKTAFDIAKTPDRHVYICGGLSNEEEILLPLLRQQLPSCNLQFITDKPVKGALLRALAIKESGE